MIHEQVQIQLDYLKSCVDGEKGREEKYKEWNIPYEPSKRKWDNISLYKEYKKEVEQNGDKNLLVMVKMKGEHGINMYGVYPFARRYVYDRELLVYRTKHGSDVLFREDEVEIV